MNVPVNFSAIAPEIVLIVVACVLLAGGVFLPQRLAERLTPILAAGGLLAALVVAAAQYQHAAHWSFDHTLRIDAFGQATRLIVFGSGLLAVCVSWGSSGGIKQRAVEFNALLLTACAGMSLLAVANSFVTLFVALELFSIALYVLVAIDIDSEPSLEGGLKYLIVGSVGAAFILYGAALVYGATGQLEFDRIAAAGGDRHGVLLLAGIAFVIVGLGFKANAAPFHMWTPDAYEGAPTPVTTFMSAATKAVALIVTVRVLSVAFPGQSDVWETGVAAVAVVSFVWGNLAALRQTNVKRMLGYSTVGHTGFLLTAVAANSNLGARALLYYLTVYATMNIGAFAVVAIRERELGRPVEIADFAGWGYRRPLLSISMLLFMLSLAGFPPTGGFIGKLYIFSAAVQNGQTYLAAAGVAATLVGLGYYLKIPFALFDRDAELPAAVPSPGLRLASFATGISAAAVLFLGIVPTPLIDLARTASGSLFG
ncbi:MAG TPA: NADH-quinone oxidoreductase subunit N [Gaiellales bacterium]|nr:NADH-quinone oxidoreductase subunit N [Gaiellales bacterium]